MDRTIVKPFEEQDIKIYAYSLPSVPDHDGCIKVGETVRNVEKRIKEQLATAGLIPKIHFTKKAQKSNGEWFHDKDLHKYFVLNGVEKKDFGTGADEWFYFNGTPELAEELTDKFISLDYDGIQIDNNRFEYKLREEQSKAVEKTLEYYNQKDNKREFLWNAKPRFGKTLTSYDFIRKIKGRQFLIVTNRPAIANSWFDDFKKFISWQEQKLKFVSDSSALQGKAITRKEYTELLVNNDYSCIYFVSLQDLKGAKVFGGEHEKYRWISELDWDLVIIDEAHEGVDTYKTDKAFSKIKRKFTLHLSGTPFKAIASQKFSESQIYNWSYLDEQASKNNWNELIGSNPYQNLPVLNLFTYQMSKLIEDKASQGTVIDKDINVDYAFDLNEFFKVENNKFIYESDVEKFLDNLSSNKFPFSLDKHRNELKHTFWFLNRVDSVKALEKLLKKHPVFKNYEVIIAAGDGISSYEEDNRVQEKSLDKVRRAINENERTITLSVGQLTTGITIPEWTGVLMLSNIKSPSLYFQAAFRCQNPYEYKDEETGMLFKKENAYVFDFAPERTLNLYDEYANNLKASCVSPTSSSRKENIKELLNFLPVIAEDEYGELKEIDAEEVLTIPLKIKSAEVVKRGFMSNLLFANISSIFNAPLELKEILDKLSPEKQGKTKSTNQGVIYNEPSLNEDNEVEIKPEIVINKSKEIFGDKVYRDLSNKDFNIISDIDNLTTEKIEREVESLVNDISNEFINGFENIKKEFNLNEQQKKSLVSGFEKELFKKLEQSIEDEISVISEVNREYHLKSKELNDKEKNELKKEHDMKLAEIKQEYQEKIVLTIEETAESIVEEQLEKVEEEKKKSTEDEVRDRLRGFSRTIPAFLMAYGNRNTTLENYEENIDSDTFLELTSITIEEFIKLRNGFTYTTEEGFNKVIDGLFDEVIFNSSVQEFFDTKERLANYFENDGDEDIFDYIPAQKTNQIFTPKNVVNMMLDNLEKNYPSIFKDKNKKFIDLYVKSGLYLTEIAKRLFKGLENEIPFVEERIKWIFEKQLFGFAPSNIIYNIAKNFIYGELDYIRKINLIECDLIPIVENKKLEEKLKEVWGDDMKFDVVIGNPPYQEKGGSGGNNDSPLYQFFVE
ncbi:DEAD/DEAH box helicase family protein [Gemelliphila palaticanis]|uniref:DEAD/DEAH box helicase family protein n=1 Tax=Gemelliphila palaticanis TaxID=81950 RepID=UPI001C54C6F8